MARAARPTLADLANKKPVVAVEAQEQSTADNAAPAKRAGAQPDGRKGVLVRIEVAGWRELRDLAAELTQITGEQHSMQSLIVEQINKLLQEHGRPPVA